jgi:cell division protein FtsW
VRSRTRPATAAPRPRRRRRRAAFLQLGVPAEERPSTYWLLLGITGVLLLIGLVMVLSASSVQSLREYGTTWYYFLRQCMWVVLGLVVFLVASRIDYRMLRRVATPFLGFALFLLVAVLVPGIGIRVNGARSWIGAGFLRIQPAEIAKLALLLFSADLLDRRSSRIGDSSVTLRPIIAVVCVVGGLMMLQPDLGGSIVLGAIVFAVLFVAGIPLLRLSGVLGAGAFLSLGLALAEPYRRDRLLAFLHPSRDIAGNAYQLNQSLNGLASGGWIGVGLGESASKYGYLPNAHTDFIFAIIGEELGLIGALLVVALFAVFAMLGVKAALRAPDRFGTLMAAGITAWVLAQALVNIGGVIGLMPITGLTLPFVSFGGSSLLVTMAATGILVNIAANGRQRVASRPASYRSPAHPAMRPAPAR